MLLDQRLDQVWERLRALDAQVLQIAADRAELFREYNELIARRRDFEREQGPPEVWDEERGQWVTRTAIPDGPLAEVVPLFRDRKEPEEAE